MNSLSPVKVMEFPVRLPSLTRREFHLYWQRHHSPHVMHATVFSQGIRKYMTAHAHGNAVAGLPPRFSQDTPYDGVSELWFAHMADFTALFGNPLYPELIQPDEARFLLQDGSGALLLAREEKFHSPAADLTENGLTKLYLLLKRLPGTTPEHASGKIRELASRWLAQPSLLQRLRKFMVSHALHENLPEGFPLPSFDVVVELWFDSPDALAECFADEAYLERIAPLEAECFDLHLARALVGRLQVIHDEYSFQPSTTQPFGFRLPD